MTTFLKQLWYTKCAIHFNKIIRSRDCAVAWSFKKFPVTITIYHSYLFSHLMPLGSISVESSSLRPFSMKCSRQKFVKHFSFLIYQSYWFKRFNYIHKLWSFPSYIFFHIPCHEIPRFLWNLKVHYRVHKSPPLDCILSHIHSVHNFTSYSFNVRFNIIFSSTCVPSLWVSTLKFCTIYHL